MKLYWILRILITIPICGSAMAGDNMDREKWKSEAIAYLQRISPTNTPKMAEIRIVGRSYILRYEMEDEGLIRLGTNGWVYLKMHSSDDEDNTDIGDIVLAIDQDGNLYQNNGHVCGGIILKSTTGKEFQDIDEFLKTLVFKKEWKRLKKAPATGSSPAPPLSPGTDSKKNAIAYLRNISPTNTTKTVEARVVGNSRILRYDMEDEGLIRLGTNEWVYLKIYEDLDRGSDIALAIDHEGNLYQNDADACGGIVLISPTGKELQNSREFLKTLIYKKEWKRLEGRCPFQPYN